MSVGDDGAIFAKFGQLHQRFSCFPDPEQVKIIQRIQGCEKKFVSTFAMYESFSLTRLLSGMSCWKRSVGTQTHKLAIFK